MAEQRQLDFDGALGGAAQALQSANAKTPGWGERALEAVREYALAWPSFRIEEVRYWAEERGLPAPPSARAWGAVTIQAKNKGWIERCGVELTEARAPGTHPAFAARWRSRLL